ncbi:MAG: ribbon-helix-helix protein, CopG family [Acidobacteriota bacterium]|nr:ribbon-helix-helix protein, CopG family [Acidobacteriota bacterium]
MKTVVQARLDPETQKILAQLVARSGWSSSKVVREALRLFAARPSGSGVRKIAGLGKFSSGIPDLGSNKKHLAGFGR